MKISHFLLAVGLSGGFMVPVSAIAGPPVPRECRQGNGQIKCDKPGCHKFCDDRRPGKHGPQHAKPAHHPPKPHAKPLPPPPPVHHAKPVPPHHVKPHPVPPPLMHRRAELEKEINVLMARNAKLVSERNEAIREADHAYNMCMRMHPALRRNCVRSTGRIDALDRQIKRNADDIERMKHELRRF
ncbi:MAG: hypothetical protein J6S69_10445 [Proteobacteria bacterium]|nr:hypothetical protein [Pseudomonadota bacterium]